MKPITRLEHFLAKLARDKDAEPITPNTRRERYLYKIAENMGTLFVHFDGTSDGAIADRSILEIADAIRSGRNVVAVYYNTHYPLVEFTFEDSADRFVFSARFQSVSFEGDSVSSYTSIHKKTDDPDADNVWTIDEL